MSNELVRALQQLLAQQGGNVPQQGFFGGSMNSLFGSPPEDMYDGKITDQRETVKEERRPDGTIIRTVETYRWFGDSHRRERK